MELGREAFFHERCSLILQLAAGRDGDPNADSGDLDRHSKGPLQVASIGLTFRANQWVLSSRVSYCPGPNNKDQRRHSICTSWLGLCVYTRFGNYGLRLRISYCRCLRNHAMDSTISPYFFTGHARKPSTHPAEAPSICTSGRVIVVPGCSRVLNIKRSGRAGRLAPEDRRRVCLKV